MTFSATLHRDSAPETDTGAAAAPDAMADLCDAPGWPRPYTDYRPAGDVDHEDPVQRLPVPWILGRDALQHDWKRLRASELHRAYQQRLCAVCGETIRGAVVFGRSGPASDRRTSGPGGCSRCMLVAQRQCPYLVAQAAREPGEPIGWVYKGKRGSGLLAGEWHLPSYDNLRRQVYARAIPITLVELQDLARSERSSVATVSEA